MAKEGKKKTEEEKAAEAAAGVPKAKDMANADGGNHWQQGASAQSTESSQQSQSQTEQVSSKEVDPTLYAKNAAVAEDVYKRTPTAVSMVMPWLKDDLDPEKAAAAKRDANFRKGLHEAVESVRVLSDIGASFAGGNAYKRNAPDYKRYEDEKAKIDTARKAALDKLFQAQAADRDYKRSLQNMAFSNSFVGKNNSQTKGEQRGNSQTNGETGSWGYQYVPKPQSGERRDADNGDMAKGYTMTVTDPKSGKAYSYTFANNENKKQFVRDRFNSFAGQKINLTSVKDADKKPTGKFTANNNISKTFLYWLYETPSGKKARSLYTLGTKDDNDKLFEIFRNVALNGKFGDEADQRDGQNVYAGDQEAISKYMEQFEEVQKITTALVNGKVVSVSTSDGSYNEF